MNNFEPKQDMGPGREDPTHGVGLGRRGGMSSPLRRDSGNVMTEYRHKISGTLKALGSMALVTFK